MILNHKGVTLTSIAVKADSILYAINLARDTREYDEIYDKMASWVRDHSLPVKLVRKNDPQYLATKVHTIKDAHTAKLGHRYKWSWLRTYNYMMKRQEYE